MTDVVAGSPLSDWAAGSVPADAGPTDDGMMGASVRRVEDHHLLTGVTTFVGDLPLEGALVAHYVTSIEAHARITRVDTSSAAAEPGVVLALSAADVGDLGLVLGLGEETPRPILATDRVRYVGEPIAVVVATDAAAAADAAELVEVDYEPLPAVIDPVAAIDSVAADPDSLLFDGLDSNVAVRATGPGDDAAPIDMSAYDVVATEEFVNQRLAPCPLETRTAASMWTDDGRLIHYASCQGVHPLQVGLSRYYGLDKEQVRVITSDVGGSFGAKARIYNEDLLLPELARRTGRPVRWTPVRSADMVGLGHSRAQRQRVTIAGDRDGTIRALSVDLIADLGAYPLSAGGLARNTGMILPGPYQIDKVYWTLTGVVTNTTPIVAYRGAGRPEAGALLDRAVDLFAAEVGLDPAAVRRQNLIPGSEIPWTNPTGLTYDSGDYPEAFELMMDAVGYDQIKARQAAQRADGASVISGVGLSVFIDRTAGIPNPEYGSLELKPDGGFRVLTGSSPYGQGHYTTWAMLVSERTGVPVDQIDVTHGDTDVVPRGGITGGSRSAQRAGSAIAIATDDLVAQARAAAANLLEANVDDIVLDVGAARFHVAGAPGAATLGWTEIAAGLAASPETNPDNDPNTDPNTDPNNEDYVLKCESDFLGGGASVPYGAYAAEVRVDTETGAVHLDRVVTVDDAGTIINPMIVFGQIHGGLAQGIGQALYEDFVYDEAGNPITATFLDYAFPSAAEMPSFECQVTQTASPNNPLGAKGIAESGCIGVVPAIQNAVIDALADRGVRHIDLPLTPQTVWAAIRDIG